MADELELFLQGEYVSRKARIEDIRRLTNEVIEVFLWTPSDGVWPKELKTGAREQGTVEPYSFSTTAMIAFALSLVSGRSSASPLAPPLVRLNPPVQMRVEKLERLVQEALDRLIRESKTHSESAMGHGDAGGSAPLTYSGTFGPDDPFTLAWLLALPWQNDDEPHAQFSSAALARGREVAHKILAQPDQAILRTGEEQIAHAFPLLRVLHLGETLSLKAHGREPSRSDEDLSQAREILLERVHRQLSESRLADSGFDAADLVFALEGWILASPTQPGTSVIDEAFRVLHTWQEHTPYWRPLRPFKATKEGLVLLPQSIEIGNSLLRICSSPKVRQERYFDNNLDLLDTYAVWLMGRTFRGMALWGSAGPKTFVGWESEHTYTLDRIHLWQTSQALIFLEHYAGMLQQYVADRLLHLSRLHVDNPRDDPGVKDWETLKSDDPLQSLTAESHYRIYERIGADFITPRQSTRDTLRYSMLLYGPPGTGKSSIAASLAKTLEYPLVTVTPSDFISYGGEAVEARAKAIFAVLEEQLRVVVLFDEIDHLLLDRDSTWYESQGDLFKMLTPGMLTKIARLAKLNRTRNLEVLFVVATNYYERIDPAIRRPGRIDAQYLVLPPDSGQRKRRFSTIPGWERIPDDVKASVVSGTARFTYTELDGLIEYIGARPDDDGDSWDQELLERVDGSPPAISLDQYEARFLEKKRNDSPLEEFALLAYLELEASAQGSFVGSHVSEALKGKSVHDSDIRNRLEQALERRAFGQLDDGS